MRSTGVVSAHVHEELVMSMQSMHPLSRIALAAATALGIVAAAPPASADVTLVNAFEVPADKLEEAVAGWHRARDFLAGQPGYRSTTLLRSLDPEARFALVNVAVWESAEAFREASARMRAAGAYAPIEGVRFEPALYRVEHADGAEPR